MRGDLEVAMTKPPIVRGSRVTGAETIGSWRSSSYFRRLRHSRKCRRCGAWLAAITLTRRGLIRPYFRHPAGALASSPSSATAASSEPGRR
jgi:hypothetical protein